VVALQQHNEELTNAVKQHSDKKSDNSSTEDSAIAEENAELKAQVQQLSNTIEHLREELANEKSAHERALEAEFEKLAKSQNELKTLQEKVEDLGKPKPITGPKSVTLPQNTQPTQVSAASPRSATPKDSGAMPAWKQREMEKQKEAEEARQAEQQRKLQKVASIRLTQNDIHKDDTGSKNFHEKQVNIPDEIKPVIVTESIAPNLLELTQEEKAAAEMARLGKTLKRGGHNI